MAWRFEMTPMAEQAYLSLDTSLRSELREQLAAIADEPLNSFRRPSPQPFGFDVLWFTYRSDVVHGLSVSVFIDEDVDVDAAKAVIVAVRNFMDAPEQDAR